MRVVKQRKSGIVRRVLLLDDHGGEVVLVNRFLSHLMDAGYSPNTVCAYGYDLRHLAAFSTAAARLERLPAVDGVGVPRLPTADAGRAAGAAARP